MLAPTCTLLLAIVLAAPPVTVTPTTVILQGSHDRQALLVSQSVDATSMADLTSTATYQSLAPAVARVDAAGVIRPVGDGDTVIIVRAAGQESQVRVTVRGLNEPSPVVFRTDVIAALSRVGCNQGACHGSPQGKNGFRLSLRGADPVFDYGILTRDQGGRRINQAIPADSLVLQKGSGRVSHQGGALFSRRDPAYQTLARWVSEGGQDRPAPALMRFEVLPGHRRLASATPHQRLVARAHFDDGSVRDVTALTVFTSSDTDLAPVSGDGFVRFNGTGEASILARYLDAITSVRLGYVRHDPAFQFVGPAPANRIDELVFSKQAEMQLSPAPLATDEVFLRRVTLDTIGTLPSAEEARAFLDSTDPDKRAKWIDHLLNDAGYAQMWALRWADVLRGSPATISSRGVHSFHRYLVRTFAEDRPLTEFARDLLTGSGNTLHRPAANFFRVARTPEEAGEAAAQLFLGVRMQCAKCHNHPFEGITQTDYYGLAAFFSQVQFKGTQFGLDDEIVFVSPRRELNNPLTRKPQPPIAFGTAPGPVDADADRRFAFADWLTRPENPFFAPAVANRVWYHLLGHGIVDPVDDFRDTNPPSNPALLAALAEELARSGYRLKPLVRLILNSRTYQLASRGGPEASPHAARAERYFTKAAVRMLSAEQVLDAVSQATGVAEPFPGYPLGTRALELAEGGVNHPFLQAFSKPVRDVTCECAREDDPSLPQMLHMLNNAHLVEKVRSPDGRIAGWLKEKRPLAWVVEQIYLATLTRRPTPEERELVLRHIANQADPAAGLEDLQYALVNVNEFLLRH